MKLFVKAIILTLASACLGENDNVGQSARTPQGHIEYSDPSGLKVNWKLYAPYSQWKSHLEKPQHSQKTEATIQSSESTDQLRRTIELQTAKLQSKAKSQQVQYKPYSAIPEHVKQLIHQTYESRGPYVDPEFFTYQNHGQDSLQLPQDQSSVQSEASQRLVKYRTSDYAGLKPRVDNGIYESKIVMHGQREYQRPDQPRYESLSVPRLSLTQTNSQLDYRKHTPVEIQQLLQFQAQIPYNVIANRIVYRPKMLFIPKPLSESEVESNRYRSKVYYLKNDQSDAEYQSVKSVEERQRQR